MAVQKFMLRKFDHLQAFATTNLELSDLTCWKKIVFQICVTPLNFIPHHRTFTVAGISDHINPETFNTNEAPFVGGEAAKHRLLPATRFKVKAMTQIHPVLRESRVAASTPVSEVTKL
ncbi:hypothetical protein IGI04_036192 [Brassica rapa subsp. trilocularis]|uniref:Uncharacterized protein n=1 Tax=Brassica rapa subsp. trilocularis TaxID=1813537 RepID=A0ABQ7LDS1_BRACM|nr:hypothetical protein IGI04_036192 [Brassica rapa subsp. trilocularis]